VGGRPAVVRDGHDVPVNGFVDAYVGLGANIGGARRALEKAVAALGTLPGVQVSGVSRLYRTRPVGPVAQPDFMNAVAQLHVVAEPDAETAAMTLLESLKSIEQALGRRPGERWGPREIDLDLLLFGQHHIRVVRTATAGSSDPARRGVQWLEVPHPAAGERLFVLAPLAELAADLVPPGWGQSVVRARDAAYRREGPEAATRIADWSPEAGAWVDPKPIAERER
jgi:2-amino-4-hydroxy-6-hydroxymethyldihydropteridine diphosphokinase